MCGLFGYFLSRDSHSFPGNLNDSCNSLLHRGPDDHGLYTSNDNRVGLAHTRLSIQDLSSAGHQPMTANNNSVALVYNGEIYNSEEIKSHLLTSGYTFKGVSDTEVLLSYYCHIRNIGSLEKTTNSLIEILKRINGIFSFAIWDSDLSTIFLVKDAFGVKPLYYHSTSNGITFSSEIKAFDALSSDINYQALRAYLSYCYSPGPETPLKSLRKVEPGQLLCLRNGSVYSTHKWFRLPLRPPTFNKPPVDYCVTKTQLLLRQAVQRQLVSDVPVGAFLSGGLDSSSIVAFAKEVNPDIRCFTINPPESAIDGFTGDLPYARRVAKHLNVPLDVLQIDGSQMAYQLEQMVWHLDEPLADPAALNVFFISKLARQQGLKVLLSGTGGDDLFTGYRRHLAVQSECLWSWLPRRFRINLRDWTTQLPVNLPVARRLRKLLSGSHLEGDSRIVHYFRWIDRCDLNLLFSSEFRNVLLDNDPMLSYLSELPTDISSLDRMLLLEQNFFLPDHNLTYTDKMSMAAGVEVRVPFLDIDLVNWAAKLPLSYKQRGRHGKWILKKAMEPYLPNEVIYRPKSGFGAPLRSWLRVELREWLSDTLSPLRIQQRGLFDSDAVQKLIIDNYEGRIDASYTLLSLALIEIWFSYFVDGNGPGARTIATSKVS